MKPITPKQRRLLRHLANQAEAVRKHNDWWRGQDLAELLQALRLSNPRARSLRFAGIRFQIKHSLCARIAACPETGRELCGVSDV